MRKKFKVILSAAIMTTLITEVTPLPASSNMIIPAEAAAVDEEKIAGEIVKQNMKQKAAVSENSTDTTADLSAAVTEAEAEDEKETDDLKEIIKDAIKEERYEKEKENLPYMIELIVSMLFLPPAVYHNSGEYPGL